MTAVAEFTTGQLAADVAAKGERVRVTRECDICSKQIEGWDRGSGSVALLMGLHKRNVHKIAGKSRATKRGRSAPTDDEYQAHPIVSSVRDVANAVTGAGTPKSDELAKGLGRGLALGSFSLAALVVETDAMIPPAQKQALIDHLAFPEGEAAALMRPVGKLLAPTKVNAKYGRAVVENVDMIGAVAGVVQFGMRWTEYLKLRRQSNALLAQQVAQAGADGMTAAHLTSVPDLETHPSGLVHTAPPTQGVVVDADYVQRLRAAQQGATP